jgi:uncharacterized protein YkwD
MRRLLPWILLLAALPLVVWLVVWKPPGKRPPSAAPPPPDSAEIEAPAPAESPSLKKWEPEPTALPGEPVTVELMEPPADRYAAAPMTEGDGAFAAIVAKLGRNDVVYDAALGRAARELAYQQSLLGGVLPLDLVDFLLRSAGAVDRTIEQGFVATSGEGSAAAREQLERMLAIPDRGASTGQVRVGIGEVWIPGAKLPHIVGVLISRRAVSIDPAPRRVELGEAWVLSGELPHRFTRPSALVLRPDGELKDAAVESGAGGRFRVVVPAGNTVGTLHVSVGATGPEGPMTLVQLPVEVGRPLPQEYASRLPPDERDITSVEAAEALALRLLNADRARFGLPILERDPRLDAVARAHSVDMRDGGFFAHVSPRTGGPGDRLQAAGYKAIGSAENIALESSIHAAESDLLASLGHRANILSRAVTHVGIGIAKGSLEGRTEWFLTQLFAKPLAAIDTAAFAASFRRAIGERRRARGLPDLRRDLGLERVAEANARAAAEGKLENLSRRTLDEAERAGLVPGKAQVWIQRSQDPAAIEAPDVVDDASFERAGVGVVQGSDEALGAIGIVLLLAADPR